MSKRVTEWLNEVNEWVSERMGDKITDLMCE